MIIVFGNQKGGCGKTTHCIQFANYLAIEKKINTLVIDLDFQQSILDRRTEDVNTYDNVPGYDVIQSTIDDVAKLMRDFKNVEDGQLLIDLPGKIDDDKLAAILMNADVIICPFKYDKLTMDSTAFFIKIIEHLEVKAKLFFLPNSVKKSVKYETKGEIIKILNQYGYVLPEIPDRVALERVNTLLITDEAISIVKDSYEAIINLADIK